MQTVEVERTARAERREGAITLAEGKARDAVALLASWDIGYALFSRDNLHAFEADLTAAFEAREDLRHAHNS